MPLEYDAQYDEHDNRCHEHATAQPRKRLILSLGVFEDLDDLADKRLEWGLFRDRRPEMYLKITQ